MEYLSYSFESQAFFLVAKGAWLTSNAFLSFVFFFGALLIAGVVLSVFTFYEDHYWSDSRFREELRANQSRNKQSFF